MPGLPPLEVPAMRCELGREKTPEAYIAHLVLCFREVYRVLRDDGVCWVVIGDSYARQAGDDSKKLTDSGLGRTGRTGKANILFQEGNNTPPEGLQAGDLLAIPYRLLLALQADGWLVRNDVVWSKVAPMPESVSGTHYERHRIRVAKSARANPNSSHALSQQGANNAQGARDGVNFADHSNEYADCPGCPRCSATDGYVLRRGSWRHTRSHETVIMLTKEMQYYSDQERVREKAQEREWMEITTRQERADAMRHFEDGRKEATLDETGQYAFSHGAGFAPSVAGRNPRDVLMPSPSPLKAAHYAAFPPDLIRPLILSSAPLKCCPVCGAGWAAVVEQKHMIIRKTDYGTNGKAGNRTATAGTMLEPNESHVIGYRPTCACNATDWQSGLVLDPFAGSGTAGLVCRELGLRFVGLDISGEYLRDIALVRSERLTPDSAMVNLPLFTLLQS